ncbi:MAG: phage portal protein, partial [Candidatus Ranarchaeia archaeon]
MTKETKPGKQNKKPDKKKQVIVALDPVALNLLKKQEEEEIKSPSVVFSIIDELKKNQEQNTFFGKDKEKDKEYRLAFESDPATQSGVYESLYRNKVWLLPDALIKKIHRSDDLIAAVLNTRGNHAAAHGRPRESRFEMGFDIIVDQKETEGKSVEELEELMNRVEKAKGLFYTCGNDKGWSDDEKLTLPQFLKMFAVDGLRFGRAATEIIRKKGDSAQFHSFRPVDAGTIYRVAPYAKGESAHAARLREQSKALLERLKGEKIPKQKIDTDKWSKEEYSWVQVIDNVPRQAFKSSELVVHNFYPSTDIEYSGYPLTPLDTIINAVTTHMNIQQHNKLYFQSGRAARGMLVIKSDSVDEGSIQKIRLQFNASINTVQNAHRMPVFGIGETDSIDWQPIDSTGNRDKEFQILSDGNARTILAAFQMSPDELPGYSHLSRATNSQSMSESNNEFKLQAARDVGLRPLLMTIQDFLNQRVFPL